MRRRKCAKPAKLHLVTCELRTATMVSVQRHLGEREVTSLSVWEKGRSLVTSATIRRDRAGSDRVVYLLAVGVARPPVRTATGEYRYGGGVSVTSGSGPLVGLTMSQERRPLIVSL